jgi:hypothetical protein
MIHDFEWILKERYVLESFSVVGILVMILYILFAAVDQGEWILLKIQKYNFETRKDD